MSGRTNRSEIFRKACRLWNWRRGRDSNPRYPFGYAGFQDRSHQPLGHLSATYNSTSALRTIELPVDGLHLR